MNHTYDLDTKSIITRYDETQKPLKLAYMVAGDIDVRSGSCGSERPENMGPKAEPITPRPAITAPEM